MATIDEKKNGIYKVGADGKGPSGLKAGDQVVTAGGTYTVTGVNADGTYKSELTNKEQTASNYTGSYNNAGANGAPNAPADNAPVKAGDQSGYQSLWSRYPNTEATKEGYQQEVQNQVNFINNNPDAVKAYGDGEFMSIYGDVMTTAPNGTQVAIKDLVDVGNGTYTYDADKAAKAKAQGYTVTQSEYLGKPAYYIEGVKKQSANGTAGADEDLLSDTSYAALLYEREQWNKDDALYKEALAAGNTELAEQYKARRDQHHVNAERLRAGSWLGGYGGGTDGSMYIDYVTEAAKGTMPAYLESTQRLLGAKGMDYTLPFWQQGESGAVGTAGGGSGVSSVGSGGNGLGHTGAPVLGDLTGKVEDYSSYLEQMYAAKKAAALAEIEAAYKQNVAALDRAGEGLEGSYQDARNQTAGASELAKRNFAQYAAANGLNSGTGGQAELSRNIALQNNMNSINSQEAQSLADLQLQRANAEMEYNNAIAQAEAEGDYELANALYQEKVRVQNALIELEIQQYQLEYQAYRDSVGDSQWQQSFDQSVAQQNWQNAFNQQQFEYGKEQDAIANSQWQQSFDQNMTQQDWENALALQKYQDALGQQSWENVFTEKQYQDALTQQEWENALTLQKYQNSLNQQQFENDLAVQKYQDGLSQEIIENPEMNLTTAKQSAAAGVFNDQVIATLRANGYTDDMLAGIYGYESGNTKALNFARYLYTATKNPDYVYKTLKSSGYDDLAIDSLMAQLGL